MTGKHKKGAKNIFFFFAPRDTTNLIGENYFDRDVRKILFRVFVHLSNLFVKNRSQILIYDEFK